jgi:putative phosphoesterase
MRIAVVADIHGNLLALDAVMTDIEKQAPDEIWCAGDIGWLGPWASECIARVRQAGWTCVKGNTDVWIAGDPQTIESPEAREKFKEIAAQHAISQDDATWLLNLPLGHSAPGSILMVHGTPSSPFVGPQPNDGAAEFAPYQGEAGLVIVGHVHKAFTRRLADSTIVVNAGSVGLPLDAETASYLLIDMHGPNWTLAHRRVPFDRRGAMAQAKVMGGAAGEMFLDWLAKGESA